MESRSGYNRKLLQRIRNPNYTNISCSNNIQDVIKTSCAKFILGRVHWNIKETREPFSDNIILFW